jgi:hypothetical protein
MSTRATHPPASGDRATVSVTVAVTQAAAFEVFTREIDLWWRRGPHFAPTIRLDMGFMGRTSAA